MPALLPTLVVAYAVIAGDVPSKAELTALVEEARLQLGSWHVEAVATQITAHPQCPATETAAIQCGAGKCRYDETWTRVGEDDAQRVPSSVMYDGERLARASRVSNTGTIQDEVPSSYCLDRCIYLRSMFYLPPEMPHPTNSGNDLLGFLLSPQSTVRPQTEMVHGQECYVLDYWSDDFEQITHTVWIDPEHGFLPRLRRLPGSAPDAPMLEVSVAEVLDLGGGGYLPNAITYTTNTDLGTIEVHVNIVVDPVSGKLRAGSDVSEEFANASASSIFVPGMTVTDLDSGRTYLADAGAGWSMSEALASVGIGGGCDLTSDGTSRAGHGTTLPWMRAIAIATGAGLALGFVVPLSVGRRRACGTSTGS